MRQVILTVFVVLVCVRGVSADDKAGGPAPSKGTITHHQFAASKVFPGAHRAYSVYVPAQYDPSKPACVYVSQDGIQYNAPAVFDQLIQAKAMPVTVGVFVQSGQVPAPPGHAAARLNRSFEYDSLGDAYARFLLDELLPHIAREQKLNLSQDGNDRAIAGGSSGGICSFTVAWERPDAFRRVFSVVGSYAAFRGGNAYPTLIRKFEPRPIRIFLQDGLNDLNIAGGDWWLANQEMERALRFCGYEVEHAWGNGGHDSRQATEIFPDVMRWLWKGWPAPVKAGAGSNHHRDILLPNEAWKPVARGYQCATAPTTNARGEVFFNDPPAGKTYRIGLDGKVGVFLADSKHAVGQAFGPDGRLYAAAAGAQQILAYDAEGHATTIAEGIRGHGLIVGHDGGIYITSPPKSEGQPSQIWRIGRSGEKSLVDTGLKRATGLALTCDQGFLEVADSSTHWLYSYRIQADGSLADRQRFDYLHVPDTADDSGADGICTDQSGRRYVATRMGVQVSDLEGRVACILPLPGGQVSGLCFGGENLDTLFATCGGTVYQRKVKVRGALAFREPVKPGRVGL